MLFNMSLSELPVMIAAVVAALTVHEWAHGMAAYKLGDPTADLAGRLSLNPMAHLDLLGALAFLFVGFGWAKPVPVDPRYLKDPRRDMMWIALAGPASNLLLAIPCVILFTTLGKFINPYSPNMLDSTLITLRDIARYTFHFNVLLMAFNLIPVPPLDGSKILAGMVPWHWAEKIRGLERYGMMPILVVLFVVPWVTGGAVNPVRWIMGTATSAIYFLLSPILGT